MVIFIDIQNACAWFLQKLNTELPNGPTIKHLGMYLKELKAGTQTDSCTPMFTATLLTIAKRRKQPESINE